MEQKEETYTGDASFAPYPLTVASPEIKPVEKGLVKTTAYEAMRHHANQQIHLLKQQAELIMQQVRDIEQRVEISRRIYEAEMRFVPEVGLTYHLYRKQGRNILGMIGPQEWGAKMPYDVFIASLRLLADKTWEILIKNDDI